MKKGLMILLCLLFASCSRQLLREEKVKGIDSAIQTYYDNDVKSVIKYNMPHNYLSPDTVTITEDLNWNDRNCRPMSAKVRFEGDIMVDMQAKGLASFIGQSAKKYGNYYFHMAAEPDGRLIIYIAFKNSDKWRIMAVPVIN